MNDFAVWIEDLLGAVKENTSPEATRLIERCGKGCAARRNAIEGMKELRKAASPCKTRSDYVDFLNAQLPLTFTEAADGIIVHLGKHECGCKMAKEITRNADALCNCTLGHEKAVWSAFLGRQVDVQIVETLLRGGSDCAFKIMI